LYTNNAWYSLPDSVISARTTDFLKI